LLVWVRSCDTQWYAVSPRSSLPSHQSQAPETQHQGTKDQETQLAGGFLQVARHRHRHRHLHLANPHLVAAPRGLEDVTSDAQGPSPFLQPRTLLAPWALRGVRATAGWRDQRRRNLVKGGGRHQHLGGCCGGSPPPPDLGEVMLCYKAVRSSEPELVSRTARQEGRSSCVETPAPSVWPREGESARSRG
jgi:hypothetical protein